FNRRFDANFLKVKELVSTGAIGAPHLLHITSRDPAPPPLDYLKVSGGIFLDMTIHDFDMARYLLDSEVEEIYATGNVLIDDRFKQANDIDTAMITLKFTNGAMGTIDNSRQAVYGYDQRVEVFGSKGAVWVGNRRPDDHCLLTEQSVSLSRPLYFFVERYRESYVTEMQAFIDAILNNTEPPVTGLDGLIPVKLGYAAKKSFAENRPVRISEIE
ncbi:MAG: inositol 2-dehydrogenase, partial [Calditrichaeota bacterium]